MSVARTWSIPHSCPVVKKILRISYSVLGKVLLARGLAKMKTNKKQELYLSVHLSIGRCLNANQFYWTIKCYHQ